jgi:3-dehydrosphinganine reductase
LHCSTIEHFLLTVLFLSFHLIIAFLMLLWQVILGGILALPALVLQVVLLPLQILLALPAAWCLQLRKPKHSLPTTPTTATATTNATHVIVTGGSSGIGLELARWWIQHLLSQPPPPSSSTVRRHRITLLARNVERLKAAKESLELALPKKDVNEKDTPKIHIQIQTYSADVSDAAALERVAHELFDTTRDDHVYLICCAGAAHPETFEKIPLEVFAHSVQTNQLGPIYTVRAFLPYMSTGHIVLVSSACGQAGVYGYTSYTPAKFALRGFAECLSMELSTRPIHVQVAYPFDTDTPGFARENETKPRATQRISEGSGLQTPQQTAAVIWPQILARCPAFSITCNVDGWMLAVLTGGFAPVMNVWETLSPLVLMNFFRWISVFYLQNHWSIVRACETEERATLQQQRQHEEKKKVQLAPENIKKVN